MKVTPGPDHEAFLSDARDVLEKHAGNLPQEHIMALCAKMLGQIVALQDQRVMDMPRAMAIIIKNIEEGNRMMVAELLDHKGPMQ